MKKSSLQTAAAVVLALLVGFVWGGASRNNGNTSGKESNSPSKVGRLGAGRSTSSGLPNVPTVSATAIFEGKKNLQERLEEILDAPMNQRNHYELHALLMELPAADFPLVLQYLSEQTDLNGSFGNRRRQMLSQAIAVMAEKDPGLVIAFADRTSN